MPLDEQRSHWDLKYEQGLPSLEKPDPFYLSSFDQFVADSFPNGGTALDLAGGIGRHALWLAKRNWQVTVVDISEVAIRKLDQKARQLDLALDLFALDAKEYPFKPAYFDLIVMFYHFDRAICPKVLRDRPDEPPMVCDPRITLIQDNRHRKIRRAPPRDRCPQAARSRHARPSPAPGRRSVSAPAPCRARD